MSSIPKLELIDVRPGDTLVLTVPHRLGPGEEERLKQDLSVFLRKRGINAEVLVLDDGMSLQVMRKS